MSAFRIKIAIGLVVVLLGLLAFQRYRWQLVTACHERGGVWDGAASKCRLIPPHISVGDAGQKL